MKTLKAFFTVSFFTLLSRIAGFVRDVLMASIVGTGPVASAFLVAFKLPNFFRKLFAEGAFNAAFVPLYSGTLEEEGKQAARDFADVIFTRLLLVLLLFSIMVIIAMPYVLRVIAPGFVGDAAQFSLAVTLSRISFGYLLLISIVSLYSGILNAHHRFAAVAAAPILLNLSFVGVMLFALGNFPSHGHALSWAVIIGGVLQLLWLLSQMLRFDLLPRFKWRASQQKLRVFFKRLVPGIIGAGVTQINLWVDMMIATFIPAAVAFLYYADRINQLPLALIGTAMGTSLLPTLSKFWQNKAQDKAEAQLRHAAHVVLLFTLPAVAGIVALAEPMIAMLYERGAFDAQSTRYTAAALIAYAIGLPAYGMIKIMVSGYYAAGDTKTPVKIAFIAMLVNVVCNILFSWLLHKNGYMAHVGLALGTAVAAMVNLVLLLRFSPLRLQLDVSLCVRMLLAASIMGVAAWWCMSWLSSDVDQMLSYGGGIWDTIAAIDIAIILYFFLISVLIGPKVFDKLLRFRA